MDSRKKTTKLFKKGIGAVIFDETRCSHPKHISIWHQQNMRRRRRRRKKSMRNST